MKLLPWCLALSLLSGCSFFAEDLTWSGEASDASADTFDASAREDAAGTQPDASDRPDGGPDLADADAVPADGQVSHSDAAFGHDAEASPPDASAAGLDAMAPLADAASVVLTDIQTMNDREAPSHAGVAPGPGGRPTKVQFKGVAVSPVFRDKRVANGTDPTNWFCQMGIYLADPNAAAPEHNGILVLSKGSVLLADAGTPTPGACAGDSPLEQLHPGDASVPIGEELEVTGFFTEDCYRTNLTAPDGGLGPCDNKDESGRELARATVQASATGSIVRTGLAPGVPSNLPVTITIDDIASSTRSGTAPNYTVPVGPKWFDYRQVLVRINDLKVVNDSGASCNFTVQRADGSGATLAVMDDVMFMGTDCPGRPATDIELVSLAGFPTWYVISTVAETQLAPRAETDIVRK